MNIIFAFYHGVGNLHTVTVYLLTSILEREISL